MKMKGTTKRFWAVLICALLVLGCAQTLAEETCAHENLVTDYGCFEKKMEKNGKRTIMGKHIAPCAYSMIFSIAKTATIVGEKM